MDNNYANGSKRTVNCCCYCNCFVLTVSFSAAHILTLYRIVIIILRLTLILINDLLHRSDVKHLRINREKDIVTTTVCRAYCQLANIEYIYMYRVMPMMTFICWLVIFLLFIFSFVPKYSINIKLHKLQFTIESASGLNSCFYWPLLLLSLNKRNLP